MKVSDGKQGKKQNEEGRGEKKKDWKEDEQGVVKITGVTMGNNTHKLS